MSEAELLQLVRAKEDEIRAQRFESAFFWDAQGNLLLHRDGERTTVKFTSNEQSLLSGAISTHNHPLGWSVGEHDPRRAGNSFSENDVRTACYLSLSILRIVTPKLRFMMKPSPQGWNAKYWEKTLKPQYDQIYAQTWREFITKVQARQMLSSIAGTTFQHEVWSRIATTTGIEYAREEF